MQLTKDQQANKLAIQLLNFVRINCLSKNEAILILDKHIERIQAKKEHNKAKLRAKKQFIN